MSRVDHPSYYGRKDGIECIDIIRHYVCDIANALKYIWRAGLKTEEGISDKDKEAEDLRKALWYIKDFQKAMPCNVFVGAGNCTCFNMIEKLTSHSIEEIIEPYCDNIKRAMKDLLFVGIAYHGNAFCHIQSESFLEDAVKCIEKRLEEIENGDSLSQ